MRTRSQKVFAGSLHSHGAAPPSSLHAGLPFSSPLQLGFQLFTRFSIATIFLLLFSPFALGTLW